MHACVPREYVVPMEARRHHWLILQELCFKNTNRVTKIMCIFQYHSALQVMLRSIKVLFENI